MTRGHNIYIYMPSNEFIAHPISGISLILRALLHACNGCDVVPRETADSSWTRPLESPPPPASSFTAGDAGTLLKTDHEEVPVKKQKHLLPGRASSDVVGSTDQAPVTDTRPEPVPQQRGALPIAPADFILWQWTTVQPPQPCPSRGSEVHPPANKLHLPGGALHHIEPSSTVLDTPVSDLVAAVVLLWVL